MKHSPPRQPRSGTIIRGRSRCCGKTKTGMGTKCRARQLWKELCKVEYVGSPFWDLCLTCRCYAYEVRGFRFPRVCQIIFQPNNSPCDIRHKTPQSDLGFGLCLQYFDIVLIFRSSVGTGLMHASMIGYHISNKIPP